MAGSAHGRAASNHFKVLMIAFGPRVSSITGTIGYRWKFGVLSHQPGSMSHPPLSGAASTWSFMVTQYLGNLKGCARGVCLGFHFFPVSVVALVCWGELGFQPASASETLSAPEALNQLFQERILGRGGAKQGTGPHCGVVCLGGWR